MFKYINRVLKRVFINKHTLLLFLLVMVFALFSDAQESKQIISDSEIHDYHSRFVLAISKGDSEADKIYMRLKSYISADQIHDSLLLSYTYYYCGTYKLHIDEYSAAEKDLIKAVKIAEACGLMDEIYYKACTNLGLVYIELGNNLKSVQYLEQALSVKEFIDGKESYSLCKPLLNLSSAYVNAHEYEKTIECMLHGADILDEVRNSTYALQLARLYYNGGIAYTRLFDYTKAKSTVEIALSHMINNSINNTDLYLRIYNILAVIHIGLNDLSQTEAFYKKSLSLIDSTGYYSRKANSVYSNYGFFLARAGRIEEAEQYLIKSIDFAAVHSVADTRNHIVELENYAFFLAEYKNDIRGSLQLYLECLDYCDSVSLGIDILSEVYFGYAKSLFLNNDLDSSLKYLAINLNQYQKLANIRKIYNNSLKSDVLSAKYKLEKKDQYLLDAIDAIKSALEIIEDSRLNINSEESRNKISGQFNSIYDRSLNVSYSLFEESSDISHIENAFVFSEKSRAAGLLSSTRAMNAMRFHIPDTLAYLESELKREINVYSELLLNESLQESADSSKIVEYQNQRYEKIQTSDSLIDVFESRYPKYYNLKHNSSVSSVEDIRDMIGGRDNFIEYYLSDTILYIFCINNRSFHLEKLQLEDNFIDKLKSFRNILLNPAISKGARLQYEEFKRLGYDLYQSLIQPIEDHLISNKIIISADDILSYIPFETLISELPEYKEINYRELAYLVKDYEIVYTYSGTLLSETRGAMRSLRNHVISYAPEYSKRYRIDSLIMARQVIRDSLANIPGAREEAIYISEILGGELYLDKEATEACFKDVASDGDILHLSMHTLLNDKDPMYSRMIFSLTNDDKDDGLLNTYEVYDIPLKAKMVFLSSCNTGSGYLQAGEGVMSLARGFFYSGSPSVVMALWEVDDESGSIIVKDFYKNLKRGKSKSKSLRLARENYLKDSDQMRSHPYFWSTLVIIGNDSALYYPNTWILIFAIILLLTLMILRNYKSKSL